MGDTENHTGDTAQRAHYAPRGDLIYQYQGPDPVDREMWLQMTAGPV